MRHVRANEQLAVGDEVDVDNGPKLTGTTRGILMSLSIRNHGVQAFVVSFRNGQAQSRISCPANCLEKTGRVATAEEVRAILQNEDADDRDVGHLVAECARLREYADVLDVLRASHGDAVRTLRAWDLSRRTTTSPEKAK